MYLPIHPTHWTCVCGKRRGLVVEDGLRKLACVCELVEGRRDDNLHMAHVEQLRRDLGLLATPVDWKIH